MSQIHIRKEGRAGRITLTRPEALNALSYDMCTQTEAAIDAWRDDPQVDLIVMDAEGPRAFCAGGDIADVYQSGLRGDYEHGRRFWRDEYRMNAKLDAYPKPIVSFLHGFVMGGGVGIGGHCSHRIVGESTQISMPECSIGFVPDVGGSYLLAGAPGRLGDYLALTAARMGAGDAIYCGFADRFIPEDSWDQVKATLIETGDVTTLPQHDAPESALEQMRSQVDALFESGDLEQILQALRADDSEFAQKTLKTLGRSAPLSMAATLRMLADLRAPGTDLPAALRLEYRASHRILELGDMMEGVRAAIIDKDRNPSWKHPLGPVPESEVNALLAPLGDLELDL